MGVVLVFSSAVDAQRWGRERFPQSGACFFKDADYRGDYFCVRAGDDVRAVPDDMNDEISSIRIFGRAEVVVFRDVRFGGGSTRFASSVRNLKDEGWNDRLSSLRVQIESRGGRFGDLSDDQRGRDRRGEDPDRIVRRAYQDVLGRDPDAGGLRQYRSRVIDDGWTEAQVRESLRSSPEYREKITMTRAKAEEIVRRAYAAVLKREPDAAAEGYIQSILRDKWSQQDVERELRKSPEFRERK
jgi:hypothetical protein